MQLVTELAVNRSRDHHGRSQFWRSNTVKMLNQRTTRVIEKHNHKFSAKGLVGGSHSLLARKKGSGDDDDNSQLDKNGRHATLEVKGMGHKHFGIFATRIMLTCIGQ